MEVCRFFGVGRVASLVAPRSVVSDGDDGSVSSEVQLLLSEEDEDCGGDGVKPECSRFTSVFSKEFRCWAP